MEKHPPKHIGVVAIEKEAFGSPTTKVAKFIVCVYLLSCVVWGFVL